MAIKVETVDILKKYFEGVTKRANHHAPNVKEVIYGLLGVIVLKKDIGTHIEVRGNNDDKTGNILWVTINSIKYAFRYEHSDDSIEIRKSTYKGPLVLKIDNSTTLKQVIDCF